MGKAEPSPGHTPAAHCGTVALGQHHQHLTIGHQVLGRQTWAWRLSERRSVWYQTCKIKISRYLLRSSRTFHFHSALHWVAGNSGYDGDIIISVQQLRKVLYFSKCQSKTKEILEISRRNYISLSKKLLLLCGAWCWWWWRDGGAVFALP